MDDVEYFKKKLYKALSVPISRLETDNAFNLGRATEISRDELKFTKFVNRLRLRFTNLFDQLLEIQLALTGVMSRAEWAEIKNSISYDFVKDNHFTELKDAELLNSRLAILQSVEQFAGKYFSDEWIQKTILKMGEDEIKEITAQIKKERAAEDGEEEPPEDQEPPEDSPQEEVVVSNNQVIVEEPTPLSKEDKDLIESMTRALDSVTKEDIKDDL